MIGRKFVGSILLLLLALHEMQRIDALTSSGRFFQLIRVPELEQRLEEIVLKMPFVRKSEFMSMLKDALLKLKQSKGPDKSLVSSDSTSTKFLGGDLSSGDQMSQFPGGDGASKLPNLDGALNLPDLGNLGKGSAMSSSTSLLSGIVGVI